MKRLLLAASVVLVCAACAPPLDGPTDIAAADSPVATYDWSPHDPSNDALMEGILELRDGCLHIVGTGDTEGFTTVPVLSRQLAAWDKASQTLTYYGVDFKMGDAVAAGGGWGSSTEEATIPAACSPDEYGEFMYVADASLLPLDQRDR